MIDYQLSIFSNTFDTMGSQTILEKELNDIRIGVYKNQILSCRDALLNVGDKDLYKKHKSQLKAVTFCGTFKGGRKLSNLVNYNSIIVIDVDGLEGDEAMLVKAKLAQDKYVMALWISPSSQGIKGLIKIASSVDAHKSFFSSLSIYFLQEYGIELDKSGSDITRLCYVSWDEDIYINYDSEVFKTLIELESSQSEEERVTTKLERPKTVPNISLNKSAYATEGLNNQANRAEIKKIIKFLSGRDLSITDNYSDWMKVAVIIANSFSYDVGESYFLSLCRIDHVKHDENKSKELLKFCYNNRNLNHTNRISFSTLIYMATLKGYVKK